MVAPYESEGDYSYDLDAGIAAGSVFINVNSDQITLYSMSLAALNSDYGMGFDAEVKALNDEANPYGYTKVTAENLETVKTLVNGLLSGLFGIADEAEQANYLKEALWVFDGQYGDKAEYDETVGCYKVDDYTIRYVTESQIDYNYFLTSCTSNWLVYEDLYEAGKDTTGALVTTDYGTSMETSMSYGPYKIQSLQNDKQIVFVQNENYYLYEKDENGKLTAVTDYLVDGEHVTAYQTERIIIDVMTDEAAKQAFLKGELSDWAPPADQVADYAASEQMYKVDETYTMSFFFNTDVDMLKAMDESKGNQNSVVLSNVNFRKAFSLAVDRADWVTATAGYKPAYALMNTLYFYDVYNDPTSSYRGSDEAMQAICNLYGVKYGEGTPYATLKEAYNSINGYNLTEAKALMKTACDELVAAGLYTAGEPIVIRIGYKKGALDSADQNQVAKMNAYLAAAVEGSGFGTVTLEAVDNINDRYGDVGKGEFAIGYGAWGGAAFYPFRNFQVYCDTEQYDINEIACWNPAAEMLTLNVNGEDVTMSWQDWSRALVGTGQFANADFKTKLAVTAEMEQLYLEKYYRIPLAGSCIASLLSYQVSYYTEDYNIMYGFGGLELMTYNYTDAEWTDYVASQGGTLSYE
jgi:oligopeptide transport system substrate-binding protein